MSVASVQPEAPAPPRADRSAAPSPWVRFHDVGWKGYLRLLKLRGERRRPRMVYLDGTVYLMSPAYPHEMLAKRFGTFVTILTLELRIPCTPLGSTTLRRRSKRGGAEGDETYYIANESRFRGVRNVDLKTDPPPDLAIEAVNTHGPSASLKVYRRLGIPEVWTGDIHEVRFYVLGPNGRYAQSDTSRSFPFLTSAEVADWLHRPRDESETDWGLALRPWITETLAPRVQAK